MWNIISHLGDHHVQRQPYNTHYPADLLRWQLWRRNTLCGRELVEWLHVIRLEGALVVPRLEHVLVALLCAHRAKEPRHVQVMLRPLLPYAPQGGGLGAAADVYYA